MLRECMRVVMNPREIGMLDRIVYGAASLSSIFCEIGCLTSRSLSIVFLDLSIDS
jgi:hypothetical protein